MKITIDFIPGLPKIPYRNGVGAYEGVVSHSTGNQAPAVNERNYETTHYNSAFVHFFCDWNESLQVADTNYIAYGAGQAANERYVHVELCETSDKVQFGASYKNYVDTLAFVLFQRKLGVIDGQTLVSHLWVTQHLGYTTHTDPIEYLKGWGITWEQHVANVQAAYNLLENPPITQTDIIPIKSPNTYRLAKFVDTADLNLIKQLKSEGYYIIDLPNNIKGANSTL